MVSVDGYFEGQNHELDWHNVDEEFTKYSLELLDSVDTLVFGRTTYELMAGYWPTAKGLEDDPEIAERMNSIQKLVLSKTLERVDWKNSKLIKTNISNEISCQKLRQCKDIAIFGSSDLALGLIPENLIDEYRFIINPILLGHGKTILNGLDFRLKLKLLYARSFSSGNVLLCYSAQNNEITRSSFINEMIN